jgi:hypothetical protein
LSKDEKTQINAATAAIEKILNPFFQNDLDKAETNIIQDYRPLIYSVGKAGALVHKTMYNTSVVVHRPDRSYNVEKYFDKLARQLLLIVSCYIASVETHDRRIGSWTQSYDFDLQRQRCSLARFKN